VLFNIFKALFKIDVTSLVAKVRVSRVYASAHLQKTPPIIMAPTTPPLDFDHEPGAQIPTKHKEAIRQLYGFAKILVEGLMAQYCLGKSTIIKILTYDTPERKRVTRTGRPSLLTDTQVDEIIEYCSESFAHRCLDY
jgi:hypothetical protein